ncbi:MAG: prolipoprotein diacylglyceryl transferase [Flavobacteriales bacterium]|nr:prolipoprotein diacylglyceryl transferase [Flavobacteriales bacterium]
MFPYLSDLIEYLFGFSFSFPLPMFGFMVALAFMVGNYIWVLEMKRKEQDGLLTSSIIKVMKGEKASMLDVGGNAFFGFVLGFKVLAIVLDYSEVIKDLPGFIMSAQGNILGGIVGAGILGYLRYRDAEKQRLPEPKEVEEVMHPYQHVGTMTFIAAIGGIFGAKVFDAIENMERLLADPITVIFSGSGLSIYGGLIIGGGSVLYYAHKKGLSMIHVFDACAPGLMLAYGVGRIGCQLSGDGDWGVPNYNEMPEIISFLPDWMWSFDYYGNINGTDLGAAGRPMMSDGYAYEGNAWPTPFYETIMAFIIAGILWVSRKKIKAPGVILSMYLMFNGVERFFIEKIRINSNYNIFGLEATQAEIIAVAMFIFGCLGIWYFTRKHQRDSRLDLESSKNNIT